MSDHKRLERIAAATRRLDRLPARIRAGRQVRDMRRLQDTHFTEPSLLVAAQDKLVRFVVAVAVAVALAVLVAGLGGRL